MKPSGGAFEIESKDVVGSSEGEKETLEKYVLSSSGRNTWSASLGFGINPRFLISLQKVLLVSRELLIRLCM